MFGYFSNKIKNIQEKKIQKKKLIQREKEERSRKMEDEFKKRMRNSSAKR